jgi:hypothetical protein
MATTTNYGWTTPDDTALVKDGASAIRTLGTSVDTTTKNLNPSTTLGDIEYRSSTANTNTRLGIGTTGQVLSVVGGVPSWATPLSGMVLISDTTASAATNVVFSSIAGTYKQLYLCWNNVFTSSTSGVWSLRFNNDSNANYDLGRVSTTTGVSTSNIDGATSIAEIIYGGSTSSPQSGYMRIDNYSSNTQRRFFEGKWINNENPKFYTIVGQYDETTTAITSLDIVRTSGATTISGTFRLYGVA